MSFILRTTDTFYAFRFLRLLTTPWEETSAFKAGVIDKDGVLINPPNTSETRETYTYFHRLVYNVKRLLGKIPLGKSKIASYLAALYLIKESCNCSDSELIEILKEVNAGELLDFTLLESDLTTSNILKEGIYELVHDIALPMSGNVLALKKSTVIAFSNVEPVGTIFSHPVFEVFHEKTKSKIFVTAEDITSYY